MEKIRHQFTSKDIAALIIPLIADSFLSILIGMADTIMVSRCGEAAVSGVSLVDTVSNLLITVFNAFALLSYRSISGIRKRIMPEQAQGT